MIASTSSVPTVHIVDDDPSVLKSVARLLRASGFTVQTFESASELLKAITPASSGCVIADLNMPDMNGIELQDALSKQDCAMPVIFLTGQGDIPTSVRAMRQGAEDFLTKLAPKEQLVDAVERALARDARDRQAREKQREMRARLECLTIREREVLQHVVSGRLNKQIASLLRIHERTVKLHRTSITTKLQIESVAGLTRFAQATGMIDSAE